MGTVVEVACNYHHSTHAAVVDVDVSTDVTWSLAHSIACPVSLVAPGLITLEIDHLLL